VFATAAAAAFVVPCAAQVDPRIGTPVSFLRVPRMAAAPVLDGRLDDPCWEGIPVTEDFAAFGFSMAQQGSFPAPASLRTAMRAGATAEGVWLGLDCYEPDMGKVRGELVARDAGALWTEDSIELYFGTDPRHMSFNKYIVNILGTQGDERAVNGVVDHAWNDFRWKARTARLADRWTAEYFFPWECIGGPRAAGETVALGVTRFSWGTGKIVGACWGAAMSNPFIYRAGVLLIEDDLAGLLARVAAGQDRRRGATWHTWAGDRLVTVTTVAADVKRVLAEAAEAAGDARHEIRRLEGAPGPYAERLAAVGRDLRALEARTEPVGRREWLAANDLLLRARAVRAEIRRDLLAAEGRRAEE